MLIASNSAVESHNLSPNARIVSSAVVGVEPKIMGIGSVNAVKKALSKANLTLDRMAVIEFNEAFSAQCLAVSQNLGLADGGAIALGHPLGMSGTRIIQAATNELIRSKQKYAVATMCVGVGMGFAVVIENVFNAK